MPDKRHSSHLCVRRAPCTAKVGFGTGLGVVVGFTQSTTGRGSGIWLLDRDQIVTGYSAQHGLVHIRTSSQRTVATLATQRQAASPRSPVAGAHTSGVVQPWPPHSRLTAGARTLALTLKPRALALTLKPRTLALTLKPRTLALTLKPPGEPWGCGGRTLA